MISDKIKAQIIELYENGRSKIEISKQLKVSPKSVYNVLKAALIDIKDKDKAAEASTNTPEVKEPPSQAPNVDISYMNMINDAKIAIIAMKIDKKEPLASEELEYLKDKITRNLFQTAYEKTLKEGIIPSSAKMYIDHLKETMDKIYQIGIQFFPIANKYEGKARNREMSFDEYIETAIMYYENSQREVEKTLADVISQQENAKIERENILFALAIKKIRG